MDVSEKWGNDIDTAVDLALAELKATRDEVEITVLEQPSRGFFGIGAKLALVRVERKKPEPEEKPEPEKPSVHKAAAAKTVSDKPEKEKKEGRPEQRKPHKSQKSGKKPEKKAEKKEEPLKSSIEKEIGDLPPVSDHPALDFLKEVTEQMGLDIEISAKADEKNVFINIQGKDSGTVIGKRGQTLDAIQYLTSLVVNKDNSDYIRVVVDAENYRAKREKTLEKLANRLADKVVKTKRSVRLEPMNPYERKVIHATLQSNPRVTTRSEGQDPYRRVIIELK